MSDHLPPEEGVWLRVGEGICMVVAAAARSWLFTHPVVTCGRTAGSLPANTAIHQLTAALQSYYAEYRASGPTLRAMDYFSMKHVTANC